MALWEEDYGRERELAANLARFEEAARAQRALSHVNEQEHQRLAHEALQQELDDRDREAVRNAAPWLLAAGVLLGAALTLLGKFVIVN